MSEAQSGRGFSVTIVSATLSAYVERMLGGTRNVRKLLGQAHGSTEKWTPESLVAAWRDFTDQNGFMPSQLRSDPNFSQEVRAEASKIYEAARRHGVIDEARGGVTARRIFWTPEKVLNEWAKFVSETGRLPTQCMSKAQRSVLPVT